MVDDAEAGSNESDFLFYAVAGVLSVLTLIGIIILTFSRTIF